MAARIAAHRRERPPHWRVREVPIGLAAALAAEAGGPALVLIDCLTVWTANCLWPQFVTGVYAAGSADANVAGAVDADVAAARDPEVAGARDPAVAGAAEAEAPPDLEGWRREREAFLAAMRVFEGEIIVVSNDVGTGIVPELPAARLFRDEQGWLNQSVAALCDEVFLVTAGLPLRLK
jgi:adenosylcobinamide kinase/adenosylcobinamide-phosphate guanylyltransferase